MLYYDFIYLRKTTKEHLTVLEYAKAFNRFHTDYFDQKYVNPLTNYNQEAPQYWRFYNKLQDIVNFCDRYRIHPKKFWEYAYEIILETGDSTKSFNTFVMDWMLDAVLKKSINNENIILAKSYTKRNYTKRNPYYLIYYRELIKRLKEKYGDEYKNKIIELTKSEKLDIMVFRDFGKQLMEGK